MTDTREQIQTRVLEELAAGSDFKASELQPLTGGTGNFIFRATLSTALPDGTSQVVVKHGEGYVASSPNFPLSTSRCIIEVECLRELSNMAPLVSSPFAIATPKILHFNPDTNTQIQGYFPNYINLKEYALGYYKGPTPTSAKSQCLKLGVAIGKWLRQFHAWGNEPSNQSFRDSLQNNGAMQQLKNYINYKMLVDMVDQYPDILGDAKEIFQKIYDQTLEELKDASSLVPIHGDFWTGNVLLPNKPIEDGTQIQVAIIDWELAQLGIKPLDVGQMVAELWQLSLYRKIDAGTWIIQGLAQGYGVVDVDFIFRTLIHVGAHLICFGSRTPNWGTPEQNKDLVRIGKDVILKAWGKDRSAFAGHDLELLFP
ncbi:unnamed protein product [Clonostachys byssicola]|uniref:Aminoglycoside phosphotransferase domain-containing protein n=1 Tax=Clonostachys byssicola TaxID=160290 RepID=A0A9N9URL8_9HYPO|nr:unnamed protein product [Clonostachys byssicola]